ncbi:E3 ubiquitin-protein ligase UBR4 [Halotydeus destructor]|nr:E3 ubiquitin-protein ligase UBR4 [Halotydeus destructor]
MSDLDDNADRMSSDESSREDESESIIALLFKESSPDAVASNAESKPTAIDITDIFHGDVLTIWLQKRTEAVNQGEDYSLSNNAESRRLLLTVINYVNNQEFTIEAQNAQRALSELLTVAKEVLIGSLEQIKFPEYFMCLRKLADYGDGHLSLVKAVTDLVGNCSRPYLCQKDVAEKLQSNISGGRHAVMMESTCHMLTYIEEVFSAIGKHEDAVVSERPASPLDVGAGAVGGHEDFEWMDDASGKEEDDSNGEDSDEDSLSNKQCTFTFTHKEFMNQHWYHCHTCNMVDGVGVCTVCAKICHAGHDVTYAKYGSFFCDCGAKEDGACRALMRRSSADKISSRHPQSILSHRSTETKARSSSFRKHGSSDEEHSASSDHDHKLRLWSVDGGQPIKLSEQQKAEVAGLFDSSKFSEILIQTLEYLKPSIVSSINESVLIGSSLRAGRALTDLHTIPKRVQSNDNLLLPTLGSQEGAFENVKLSYTGDQGPLIRQLIGSNVIRRVAMCLLNSVNGKRQHLAVSHEKGKITLLQLSVLLKQADSSKRKLTLTRLASAPVPFTVLSIVANPCNEDYLAVLGLKDCHILTFSSNGTILSHVVVQLHLDTGNYVIKGLWLPGSHTEFAVVTSDFVKIYDLSVDAEKPTYYFLPSSGKIRDVTFVFSEKSNQRHILIMTSTGHIISQEMCGESSATNGPFYVTNILEVLNTDMTGTNVNGGGVSIYYSHLLQLLFMSYTNGRSFMAPLSEMGTSLPTLFPIDANGSSASTSPKSKNSSQPLCSWSEIANHPGLILASNQLTNNPVILMVTPTSVQVQEIKFQSVKFADMVALRHSTSTGDLRTTLILLCEDGSLRIYMASNEATSYWLKIQTNAFMSQLKGTTKLSVDKKPAGDHGVASEASAALTTNFPVDFFEHCHVMTEQIEFGGNDVLQVYNVQQIKTRLNTSGQYIASTKPHFAIDVVNNDPTMVMVGVRVLVGTQDVSRAPSYFELFGRSVQIGNILQSRWFDLPLAREESLQADKRFSLVFGASSDANGIIMVDSIKVYGKSKEAFGWPDEDVEYSTATSSSAGANETLTDISAVEKLLATTFSVLQGTISKNAVDATLKSRALTLVADMFTLPFSQLVTLSMKSLMVSLYSSRQLFYTERDHLVLEYVVKTLIDCEHLDGDTLLRLVLLCRTICSSRPSNFSMLKAIVKTCLSEIQAGPANPSSSYQKTLSDSLFTMAPFELFVKLLFDAFWRLYSLRPKNGHLASISASGLIEPDIVVESLVDIVHALTLADLSNISFACKYYLKLLLCDDTSISFAAKVELIRVLKPRSKKRKVAQSETSEFSFEPKFGGKASQASSMPGPASRTQNVNSAMTSNAYVPHQAVDFFSGADFAADLNEATFSYSSVAHNIQAVEEMLEMGASFADLNMADLQGDADDDAMAELAMALSLQDQNLAEPSSPSMLVEAVGHVSGAVSAVASHAASGLQDDRGQFSDTTASAAASDDEGSTAATEGSTLRTSPTIEQAPRLNESELASPSESVIGESGHSSAYGEEIASQPRTPFRGRMESLPETDTESSETWNRKLHSLRIVLLEKLIECLPSLREVGGVRCIPVMQVMLMLSSDLESEDEVDMSKLSLLLDRLLRELQFGSSGKEEMTERTRNHEVQLIIMRFLSIMMSRIKSSSPSGSSSKDGGSMSLLPVPLISSVILSSNLLELCLHMLVSLLDYWRLHPMDENTTEASRNVSALLKLHSNTSPPDMSPFFLKQYVKSHAEDVFELYPQLLTEMVLRLPYQMKKMSNALESMSLNPADLKYGGKQVASLKFSGVWLDYLCEYMMTPLTPYVKKQVRKLLSYICNSKEMYRQIRDNHALGFHLKKIKSLCKQGGFSEHQSVVGLNYTLSLDYDATITLVENLKACNEIASNRMHNWQRFCLNDTNVLPFLVRISLLAEEGVSSTILQLLLAAVSPSKNSSKSETLRLASEPSMNDKLSSFLLSHLDSNLLSTFIKCFLLEFKSTSLRWQAHSLVYNLYKNFELSSEEQLVIIETLWSLWPLMPSYGKKAAQFVDILGYFTLCAGKQNVIGKGKERMYAEYALNVLKSQNALLQNHPNSTMYNSLQSLVEFDGYYLESEPCLVCNNPEISFANIKLSSLKVDSRFTTTTQIVKLVGSHAISKISIRISDIKRSKMVKTLSIYYNNRTVHSVVELKNKTNIWHKAKKCPLTTGQSK